ncbi:MAG: hypothetical protein AB7U73_04890, partial [Pirellulales bacterium]
MSLALFVAAWWGAVAATGIYPQPALAAPPDAAAETEPATDVGEEAETSEPPSAELAAEVRSLLRQLDSAELARRDAAEARLTELGPAVSELLPRGGQRLSAEVEQRVERIRAKLELARARKFVQPSRVTLKGRSKLS